MWHVRLSHSTDYFTWCHLNASFNIFSSAPVGITSDISSSVLPVKYRLNGLRWVKSESMETVNQVTQLDLRDNCLDSLDLSCVCNLETLHCQRNQLGTLTLSGFTLRMIQASNNRKSKKASASCCYCLTDCFSICLGASPKWYIHFINTHECPSFAADCCFSLPTGLTTVNIYPVPNQLTHMDVSQWVLAGNKKCLWSLCSQIFNRDTEV